MLLVNADLSEVSPFLGKIFSGPFSDYTPLWYSVTGYYLVQTMLLNVFMTPINSVIARIIQWVTHKYDGF